MAISIITDMNVPTLAFAGSELTRHLEMTGLKASGEYPVSLQVWPELAPGGEDCFQFEFCADGGEICGSNARSVLLGVYAYLRELGFVFLFPTDRGTHAPALSEIEQLFCGETVHKASFRHRGVCIEGADSEKHVLSFIDWLPKNGFNSFFLQFKKPDVFLNQWYDHVNNPLLEKESKTREELDEIEQRLTAAMVKRGVIDHRVGHGWTGEAIGLNTTGWYEDKTALPEETELLTAEVNGERGLWHGVPTNTNLCYSNPKARARIIERIAAYAKENPSVDYVHFWLADANNNHCECEECRKSTPTDLYVEMLNELDEALTKEGLDTRIVFLLYQELLYAPVKAKLKNPDRFCLMFAPISRTFERSYPSDFSGEEVEPFVLNRFKMPRSVEGNLAHYFNWKKVYGGDGFFYDYPLGRAHYGDFGYMKISKVIYDDIHTLKALDTNGYMSCQELRAMCPTGFPNYVMGLSLLDDSIPYEKMKQDYFRAMFGSNSGRIIEYLEELSRLSDTDYFKGEGERLQPEKRERFEKLAETARAFLQTADSMLEHEPGTADELEFLKFHAQYCVLLAQSLALLCCGEKERAQNEFEKFLRYIRENELKYSTRLDVFRVVEVSTNYAGFERRTS